MNETILEPARISVSKVATLMIKLHLMCIFRMGAESAENLVAIILKNDQVIKTLSKAYISIIPTLSPLLKFTLKRYLTALIRVVTPHGVTICVTGPPVTQRKNCHVISLP